MSKLILDYLSEGAISFLITVTYANSDAVYYLYLNSKLSSANDEGWARIKTEDYFVFS